MTSFKPTEEDYQTLATAINTLLYAHKYTDDYFGRLPNEHGLILESSNGSMRSIHQLLKTELVEFGLSIKRENEDDKHGVYIRIDIPENFTQGEFVGVIKKLNDKATTEFKTAYVQPLAEHVANIRDTISGLVNPRIAERVAKEMRAKLRFEIEELVKVEAELAKREDINGSGWVARSRAASYRGNGAMHDR